MGDESLASDVSNAKHRLNNHTLPPPPSLPPTSASVESHHLNGADEPYTIKCICGFDDDAFDGNVVLCDSCNSWQHISCYYFPQTNLAESFEHVCVDCDESRRNRLDATAAAQRQANLRPSAALADARRKRLGSKSHKKSRTRDLSNATDSWHNNGDSNHSDGRADSPRDNGPPSKRSKTSHKHSASTNNTHSRPLNGRTRSESVPGGPEPPKLPLTQCPPNYFSPEFIRVHHENTNFRPTETNVHHNLDVATLLSRWLDDPELFNADTGQSHENVFKQFPQPLEELETPIQKHIHVDQDVEFHGRHPAWPYLTVETDLMAGDYVGELKGSIGRRKDYINELSNNWSKLRHPDHFVFFHPVLPIYIDSRTEGTLLRYARRSCQPNMRMETIITGAREYRFCFTALKDIPKGAELTIPWDTVHDSQLTEVLKDAAHETTDRDAAHISDWAATVLAHFGGCACEHFTDEVPDGPCPLAHFDRRLADKVGGLLQRSNKARRKKKSNRPDADRPANSRASSDGPLLNHDGDVEMGDDRSQSHSSDYKSSRDGTPNYSRDPIAGNQELSARDKRKLLQQEKLFEQMEQDTHQTGQRKRKRNSGSNAPTPTATAPRQFGRSSSSQVVNNKSRGPQSPGSTSDSRTPVGRSIATSPGNGRPSKPSAPRPVYVDASTQTQEPVVPPKPKYQPLPCRTKQLLKRSLLHSHRKRLVQPSTKPASDVLEEPSDVSKDANKKDASPPDSAEAVEQVVLTVENRTEAPKQEDHAASDPMDTAEDKQEAPHLSVAESEQVKPSIEVEAGPSSPAGVKTESLLLAEDKPQPLLNGEAANKENNHRDKEAEKSMVAPVAPMHIDLPNDFTKPATPAESPVQTPTGLTTPQLPSLAASSQESAAKPDIKKKKMSLSDYLKRKTETPVTEKTQSQVLAKTASPSDEVT